jgi:hypothetical protein
MSGHDKKSNGGYEQRDANIRFLGFLIAGLGLLTVLGMVVSWLVFRGLDARYEAAQPPAPPLAEARPAAPPEPRLQMDPRGDLAAVRQQEAEALGGYGWVDRDAGIARIPIERAMELLAKRGSQGEVISPPPAAGPRPQRGRQGRAER